MCIKSTLQTRSASSAKIHTLVQVTQIFNNNWHTEYSILSGYKMANLTLMKGTRFTYIHN